MLSAARARLAEIDPTLPLLEAATAREIVREQTARPRLLAQLLAAFGALSLVLAVTGVYGAVALEVSRRRREVGIPVALGAGSGRVLREVVFGALKPVLIGVGAGAAASLWAAGYLEGHLYRIPATDPVSLLAGAGLLIAAATAACWRPARRASRIDPNEVLRTE